jgi:hypothetical protein
MSGAVLRDLLRHVEVSEQLAMNKLNDVVIE